jgi:hypothetical protein
MRSTDGGASWVDEGLLHAAENDDWPYSYHGTFISRLNDGTLVVCPFRADRSDPDHPFFSDGGGLIANESLLFTSEDDGHTWSGSTVMRLPEGCLATPAQSVIELRDGRWLATFDAWPAFDDPGPYRPRMIGLFSDDRGQTWSDMTVMADGTPDGKGFWHGRAIRLADDRLFALFWSADMTDPAAGAVDLPIHYAYADPDGRNWQTPQPTAIPGQTNCVAELPDGRLAAIYTLRESDAPGFMVVLSTDGGRTWDLARQTRAWDATGWTHIGFDRPDRYPRSHDTIAFGAPSLIVMSSGELLATWWCTLASVTHTRWARLRVDD